jgi:kumamolisin
MRTLFRVLAFCLLVAGAFMLAGISAASSAQVRPDQIAAFSPSSIRSAKDLGPLPLAESIQVLFSLPLRDRAGLDRLIALQHNRHSPLRHHWLTPRQFDAYFGADPAAVAAIAAVTRANGLHVDGINGAGTLIEVSGSTSAFDRFFRTRIDRVEIGGELHFANVQPALRPDALGNITYSVFGLDDLAHARPLTHVLSPADRARQLSKVRHDFGSGFAGSYVPAELAGLYDMPIAFVTDGSGSTIATLGVNKFRQTDLNGFYTNWLKAWYASLGEPATGLHPTIVVVEGHPRYAPFCATTPNCSLAVTADIQQSLSYQPGANEIVYETANLAKSSILKAFNDVVSANAADDVNAPFGACEDPSFDPAVDALIAQGSSQGQSFFAASGDYGARCFNGNSNPLAVGVEFPASDPNVTAVGGTTLTTDANAQYVNETAWSGSGGGVSTEWAIPSYQVGIPGEASTTNRNVPDATLNADPASGDDVFFYAHDTIAGGTSISSSEIMAGFNAIVAGGYGRQGGFNQEYYFIESTGSQGSIIDITTGSNGLYLAGPGYDNVTGWGSVDNTNLYFAWF